MYDQDIHSTVGVICSDCHGGDPSNPNFHGRKEDNPTFIGKPLPSEIPQMCNKCHGDAAYMRGHNPSLPVDQYEKYLTSRHGQLLLEQGDTKVAQCVSCHSVHDIRRVGEPGSRVYPLNLPQTCANCHSDREYMADYGIPTDQYELFAQSVHGIPLLERGDVGAPACNDCHSNHGAFPPEVSDITAVCGMCHVNNQKLYRASFHSEFFEMLESPGCVTCHSNHGIMPPSEQMLGEGDQSVCGACHAQDPDDPGFAVSLAMKATLDSLTGGIEHAAALVELAEQKGMEASDLTFQLRDIRQSYIQTRTQVHTFSDSAVAATARPGLELAAATTDDALMLLDEHEGRRWWLAGATLVLLIVIGALYLKLREVESE
jgi:predicted CXXCH cytochrome family protein